jgi:hypothetical protein
LVREPSAANPHARFDERGVETGQGVLLGHWRPKGPVNTQGSPNLPRHSSTLPEFSSPILFPDSLSWLGCGKRDGLIRVSQGVHAYLKEKDVPHIWHVDGNAHDPTC